MTITSDKADGSVAPTSPTSPQLPDWPLRRPASRRISNPISLRLQTITEGHDSHAPPIPARSNLRDSGSEWSLHHNDGQRPPPSYNWVPDPDPVDASDGRAPIEGTKLSELRKKGGYVRDNRGGKKRLMIIIAILLIIIVGLAVGLGVGLTVGKHGSGNQQPQQSGQPSGTDPNTGQQNEPFPLGEYSFITVLQTVNTNCTSNAATWTCQPYTLFNPSDPSTNLTSRAIFNWIIAKTDANYATITSGATPSAGINANLTISSSNNPFSVNITDRPLTYIASSMNDSRLTFSFIESKPVFPRTQLGGQASTECFYNQTTFMGTLYLSAGRQYPDTNASSTSIGGYQQWPFAIEIAETSPGGANVPVCYEYINSQIGNSIDAGLTPQESSCQCKYSNTF